MNLQNRLLSGTMISVLALLSPLTSSAQKSASCTFHLFQTPFTNGVVIPEGINTYGTIVGYVDESTGLTEGFIRYSNGGVTSYHAPDSADTTIMRRNSLGADVGSYTINGSSTVKGFVASGSRFQSVTFPGSSHTELNGINKPGTTVGDYIASDGHFHGFKLQNGQFSSIHPSGATDTYVTAINDKGLIVGWYYNGGGDSHGFLLQNGSFKTLDFPNEVGFGGTALNDISNSGEIVGAVWTGSDTRAAFVYTAGAFKVVSVPNSRLTEVNGINAANVIAGRTIIVSSTGNESDTDFTATCN
jgi:probable HAF family extracellular repeat protein